LTEVLIALIAAVPASIGAWAALTIAKRTRTANGSTIGELAEELKEDIALVKVWMVEHMRTHEGPRQ
jgi:hypothetical protein